MALSGDGEGGGIHTVELYRKVRLACREGMSERAAAKHFGVSRESVRKMLRFSVPPGYRRTAAVRRPKLEGFTALIEQWLEEDRSRLRKQRHTAKRIFDRLRTEYGFVGSYTIVKDYVREHRRRSRELFVPLAHPPGHAQADFGEARVVIGGVERKAHFFAFSLPYSDACYVRAYRAATPEAWVDGHQHAFRFFGSVPRSVLYDNDRCLVSRILPDGTRQRARLFSGFLSHYLIRDRYGRPGKGNDKGAVEGLVGWARRNFMVPVPRFGDFETLNRWLEARCRERQEAVLRGHQDSIGARLARDREAMGAVPGAPFEACEQVAGHQACREGFSALYLRIPRLLHDFAIARGDGTYPKLLASFAKLDLIALDDFGLAKLNTDHRRDLLELLEDRYATRSTLVTSQLPLDKWHDLLGDPTFADAILDRLVHNAYKLPLKGGSMRKKKTPLTHTDH